MTKTIVKIKLLNIENNGYHLCVKAKINGKIANLLVDTGASRTVFDVNRIDKFVKIANLQENEQLSTGLGTTSMKSHITELKKIQLEDLIIKNYPAVFLDLSHVNESYERVGLAAIDGVVGSDLLHEYKAIVNYEKLEISLKYKKEKKNGIR